MSIYSLTVNGFPILILDNTVDLPPKIYRLETVSASGDLAKDSWNGDTSKPVQATVPLSQTDLPGQAISIVSLYSFPEIYLCYEFWRKRSRIWDGDVTDIEVTDLWGKWVVLAGR